MVELPPEKLFDPQELAKIQGLAAQDLPEVIGLAQQDLHMYSGFYNAEAHHKREYYNRVKLRAAKVLGSGAVVMTGLSLVTKSWIPLAAGTFMLPRSVAEAVRKHSRETKVATQRAQYVQGFLDPAYAPQDN